MKESEKVLSRRELFKQMVSKDTIKQVAGAWYGFSKPVTKSVQPKAESLLDKVQRLNIKNSQDPMKHNGKEG